MKMSQVPQGDVVMTKLDPPWINCMWWVAQIYQTCLAHMKPSDNIYIHEGQYHKQPIIFTSPQAAPAEGLLLHFQEWKKGYSPW